MPSLIQEPGLFFNMSSADYLSDPCPSPSFTQSLAKVLLEKSPLHAWYSHPRLNSDFREDNDRKFDVGNISHKLMIGRGKEIVVLDEYDDWRTKDARAKRDEAAEDGKIAVLGKHFSLADRMVRAAREQLEIRHLGHLFVDGMGEVVTAWREQGEFWCRQMIDWLTHDRYTFVDYKTTDMSVAPHGLGRMMVNAGWPIQAAMGERGLCAIDGDAPRRFLFVVQETDAPYCLNVVEMSEAAMMMGHRQLSYAFDLWVECIKTDRWPGYPPEIISPEYPGWHESQWLEREIHDAARSRAPTENLLMAG